MKKITFNIETLKTTFFYILLFLLSTAIAVKSKNYDFDLWARLIAGMAIVQTGQILKFDFLSYTPTHKWFDHEWGASVVFYLVENTLGHLGLLFLQALLIFLTMVFLVKTVKVRCGDVFNYKNILIYFIILNSFTVTYSSLIRCHSFTFLFFIIEIYILEKIRKSGNYKLLYIFPPLFLIWGNMHGGVVSGLGILAIYTIGEFLNKKTWKPILLTVFISTLMLFINPYGIGYVKFLIDATLMPREDVVEWWWIFHKYNYYLFLSFKFSALFFLFLELVKIKKLPTTFASIDKTKFLVMLVTLYLAVRHVKMMPFFAITATAYCYEDIYLMFKNFRFPKWSIPALNVVLLMFAVAMLSLHNYKPMVNLSAYPIMEVEFVRVNKLSGNLLINFGLGSYASYKLYPQNKIYMDGRYEEVYNEDLMVDLNNMYTLKHKPDNIFKKNMPDVIILEQNYPMFKFLSASNTWYLVFKGVNFGVFVKKEQYKDDFIPPSGELDYYRKTLFNTSIAFKGKNKIDINSVNRAEMTNLVPYEARVKKW